MSLLEFAKRELDIIPKDEEGTQEDINKDILELVEVFNNQGHDDISAPYVIAVLNRLLNWLPVFALTGEESEWGEPFQVLENTLQQNKRSPKIFRENFDSSKAYNVEGRVFSDDGGETYYITSDSEVSVTFPYVVPEEPEFIILSGEEE